MSAADRVAVDDLLVGYFRGFDERRTDDAFLRETFTADAHWRFPRGDATGIEEIIERRGGALGIWKETLHSVSSVLIELDGDRARFTATLLATHIHRDDDPGAPLQIGGRLTGEAARADAGWRLRRLGLDLVWTDGDPAGQASG
jgi:SnoaL-like domain